MRRRVHITLIATLCLMSCGSETPNSGLADAQSSSDTPAFGDSPSPQDVSSATDDVSDVITAETTGSTDRCAEDSKANTPAGWMTFQ